jgi:uncharacterized membrane protein
MKRYNQIAGQSIHRIEALSDGVFAIALTLLVLDIKVPISEHIISEKDLMHAFSKLTPRLLAYFLSFMTLGIFWTSHSAQLHFIEKSDRNFNWINLFFLLFVTIIPFTTAFLSEHITFNFAVGIYWLNLFLLGLMLFLNWNYAERHKYISSGHADKNEISKAMKYRGIVAQSLYAFGALLCLVNNYLSIAVLIAIQLNFALALFSRSGAQKR